MARPVCVDGVAGGIAVPFRLDPPAPAEQAEGVGSVQGHATVRHPDQVRGEGGHDDENVDEDGGEGAVAAHGVPIGPELIHVPSEDAPSARDVNQLKEESESHIEGDAEKKINCSRYGSKINKHL